MPGGLVGRHDAALGEKVFDVAEAERESILMPDRVTNNRWPEAIAWIATPSASSYGARGCTS